MREALESGELPERRWESYLKLQREARWMAMRHDARLRAEERARWKRITKEYRQSGQPAPDGRSVQPAGVVGRRH